VTQDFQIRRVAATVVIGLALLISSCATLPRQASPDTQSRTDVRRDENNQRLNINSASAKELENLPGVGKVIAERILAYREQYGPFRRPEHLMMVRGVSDRKFREIRPLICAMTQYP
jgi:competence protein ComEA